MRLRVWSVPLVVLASLFIAAAPVQAQQSSPDDAAIRKLVADFTAILDRADADAYGALHVDNAYVVDLGTVLVGRKALVEKAKADFAGAFKGTKYISHRVEHLRYPSPGLAIGTTSWEISIPKQPNMRGVALFVASKHDGRWVFEGWQAAPLQP